jgi:hypothetical protein
MGTEVYSVCVRALFKLTDEAQLREFVRETRSEAVADQPSFSALAYSALVSPESAPAECGFELVSGGIDPVTPDTIRDQGAGVQLALDLTELLFEITLVAEVFDAQALFLEAQARYAAVTGDEEWEPEGLAEAVYMVMVGCNADPVEPETAGLELVSYIEEIDVPYIDSEISEESEDGALEEAA